MTYYKKQMRNPIKLPAYRVSNRIKNAALKIIARRYSYIDRIEIRALSQVQVKYQIDLPPDHNRQLGIWAHLHPC